MSAPRDPFQPAPPGTGELGRLVTARALHAGWPCRHCGHPLALIRNMSTMRPTPNVACCNCDQPGGTTP